MTTQPDLQAQRTTDLVERMHTRGVKLLELEGGLRAIRLHLREEQASRASAVRRLNVIKKEHMPNQKERTSTGTRIRGSKNSVRSIRRTKSNKSARQ